MDKIELLGGACFSHGPYTFYKAVRIGNGRALRLGSFFLTKLWTDADLVSIGELQLLWLDSRGSNQPLASLRLYFLPENTPDGRRNTHGEDEVLTISEKVVVRVHDLVTWLSPSVEWSWGREISLPTFPNSSSSSSSPARSPRKNDGNYPQILTDPGIDFTDVDKQQREFETNNVTTKNRDDDDNDNTINSQTRVVVLSYPRYCRYRALLRKLEGVESSWLCSSIPAALGGFSALPGTKVLFCRDTFDYPDLETHELLCNHLAPKLKGRPRRKRKKRSASPGESSNESEASVASTSRGGITNLSLVQGLRPPLGVRRSERNTSGEEKRFLTDVHSFMRSRGTPVGKMPLLGYRQIDLFLFYTKVQKLGGYDNVSGGRLWKTIYDDIGGNVGSTSAATITRRHYERLLLPYERHQRGEETKVRPIHGRRMKYGSMSRDSNESKPEIGRISNSESASTAAPTIDSSIPQLHSILSSSPFLPGEKPKTETGKTSSLRSVRVKPERLKSLSTIIANQNNQTSNSSSPPSSNPSNSSNVSSVTKTASSATRTNVANVVGSVVVGQSVLECQLNSPLITQQGSTSTSPSSMPVNATTTNSVAVVNVPPSMEKDIKDTKLDSKSANLLVAQGKENIPIFDEKPIFTDKTLPLSPKSPEVIDLELENDTSRDKIVIPSFKKRKLEILREGGLEVTAVDLDSRPSVIQATILPVSPLSPVTDKIDDKICQTFSAPTTPNSLPKLISLTVTPDIGHMLPLNHEQNNANEITQQQSQHQTRISVAKSSSSNHQNQHQPVHTINNNNSSSSSSSSNNNNNNNNNTVTNNKNNNSGNSRVINVGSPSNASLLQLYANATSSVQPSPSPSPPLNHRFVTPSTTNDRQKPPKVTQSRSIFAHSEKIVYGNPKDILATQKYHRSIVSPNHQKSQISSGNTSSTISSGILDLTHRQTERSFARPNLEIVRVPVVSRTNLSNSETKSSNVIDKQQQHHQQDNNCRKSPFPVYAGMLDSRTMASNNLEITLVNSKQRSNQSTPGHINQASPSPPNIARFQKNINKNGIITSNIVNNTLTCQPTQRHHQNGKYLTRSEPVSPYATRKPANQPIIPNIPNLHNHNNTAHPSSRTSSIHQQQQQQQQQPMFAEKRKTINESTISHDNVNIDHHHHNHRRISESDKTSFNEQQHINRINPASSRQANSSRRHSVPTSLSIDYNGPLPQNSTPFLGQIPNAPTKFLPILDPLYYSAFYNGIFPPSIDPSSQTYVTPEFNAYYKELLESPSSQTRLAINGQHQPPVPTSK